MKKIKIFTLLGMFSIFSFWGCEKDASSITQDNAIKATATTPTVYAGTVTILNSAYDPSELYVREKGTVLWANKDNTIHTVTANDGTFDSGDLQPGATFSYTFNTRGDYYYHCKYHSEMTGVIKAVVIIK